MVSIVATVENQAEMKKRYLFPGQRLMLETRKIAIPF
jgi:hypothetical protein